MIALLPVPFGVDAVRANRIVAVRRQTRKLLVWVEFGGTIEQYEVQAPDDAIRVAWTEFVKHCDTPSYVWDLTWLRKSPAPEALATGD
jgi:hypothetical protein